MSKTGSYRSFLNVLALIVLVAASGLAQTPDKGKPAQDVADKPRNQREENKEIYKKWLDNDVAYIITSEEKKAFKALATDEERENFIEQFWLVGHQAEKGIGGHALFLVTARFAQRDFGEEHIRGASVRDHMRRCGSGIRCGEDAIPVRRQHRLDR